MKKTTNKSKSTSKKSNKSVYEKVVVSECGTRNNACQHAELYKMISIDDDVVNGSES